MGPTDKQDTKYFGEQKSMNPNYEIISFELDSWAKEYNLFESDWEKHQVEAQMLNKFASRLYPNASMTELLPISKLILVLFLADDRADRLQGEERINFWRNMLREFENDMEKVDALCWEKILPDFLQIHGNRNISSMALAEKNIHSMIRNFIKAGIWESKNLLKNTPPLPADYLKKLKHSSGAEIAIHYLTFIKSNIIDLGTLYSPELKQLRKTLLLLICLSNDLASFRKEENTGDFHNLVLLYEIHFKLTRSESIIKVTEKLNHLKKDYLSLQNQFLNNRGICPEKKISICDSFNKLLLGCEIWAKEDTGRYG